MTLGLRLVGLGSLANRGERLCETCLFSRRLCELALYVGVLCPELLQRNLEVPVVVLVAFLQ